MIRELKPDDLSLTRECAFGFFSESRLPGELNFEYWCQRWRQIYQLDIGVIIGYFNVDKLNGLLGGLCVNCMLTAQLEAIEAFWYVQPNSRSSVGGIKLLRAFENWAKERGAIRVKMATLDAVNPDKVSDLYLRMGYEPLQYDFVKNLVN